MKLTPIQKYLMNHPYTFNYLLSFIVFLLCVMVVVCLKDNLVEQDNFDQSRKAVYATSN